MSMTMRSVSLRDGVKWSVTKGSEKTFSVLEVGDKNSTSQEGLEDAIDLLMGLLC